MKRRFVLIDRDGTLIEDRVYLSDPDGIEFRPNALEGLARLRDAGFGLVLVTNQSGIARGFFDEKQLAKIHERLRALLAERGLFLDAIYYCPHGPDDDCTCRKPKPGLIFAAAGELGFDPRETVMIGDSDADMQAAGATGATGIQVYLNGNAPSPAATRVADDLLSAADLVIARCA